MSTGILHTFYCSKDWISFRERIISDRGKDGIKCEICGRYILSDREIHIHHTPVELTEKNYTDKNISLNPDNVKMVCMGCHNKEHGRFCGIKKQKGRGVYLVYGAPLSGKKTLVLQNMEAGDIVADMDLLYEAVSGRARYDKPDCLKYNVFGIRDMLLEQIKTRYGRWHNAWIIGGYPNMVERERLVRETGAEEIFIDTPREVCIQRLEACQDYRSACRAEWRSYIERWFETYTAPP